MKHIFSFLIFFIFSISVYAQQQPYQLDTDTRIYVPLDISDTIFSGHWDDPIFDFPLGFEMIIFGDTFSQIGTTMAFGNARLAAFNGVDTMPLVQLAETDIINRDTSEMNMASPLIYTVDGLSGNRIGKFEWQNVGVADEFLNGTVPSFMNFQLWLYEATGIIELHFGPANIENPSLTFLNELGPTTGLARFEDLTISEAYFLDDDPQNPELKYVTPQSIDIPALLAYPDNGTVYRFDPRFSDVRNPHFEGMITLTKNFRKLIVELSPEVRLLKPTAVLMDVNGRVLEREIFSKEINEMSMEAYPSGVYLFYMQSGDKVIFSEKAIRIN